MISLTLYAGSAVFGGILIGASVLGVDKSHQAELHADAHVDHGPIVGSDALDHDAQHGDDTADVGTLAAMLLSIRFWTFFLASFGVTGTLLHFVGLSAAISFPIAVVTGGGIGVAVAMLFNAANKRSVGTIANLKTLMGKEGVVLLSISATKAGKIRIVHDGADLDLLAETRDSGLIEIGTRVLVVDMKNGTATVTPLKSTAHTHPSPA
jgi:membrane protein implicated in regulation of membrane protease activity